MSQYPPPYTQQPFGNAGYQPQNQNFNGQYQQNYQPYPAGQYNPQQPQVVYVERGRERSNNDWWLTSLLAMCCGCFLGEMCCDQPCLCCVFPCPRFGR